MICPLWNVNTSHTACSTLGWSQTQVGKAYSSLYPNDLHFTKSCGLQEAIVNNIEAGMATVNFHNCLHFDKNDKNEISHCSFSPPSRWKNRKEKKSKCCAFSTSSVIVDLSVEPQRISFLPEQVYHDTSEPLNTPSLPKYLAGSKTSRTILEHKEEVLNFLEESMLAWGTWSHINDQSCRSKEWHKCVEGVKNKEEKKKRRELVNGIWSDDENKGNKTNAKQRVKGYQRKEKRKVKRNGKNKKGESTCYKNNESK